MRVIFPTLPDPTDVVMQGEQSFALSLTPVSLINPVLGVTATNLGWSWPFARNGRHAEYGLLNEVGPKTMSGGSVEMLSISNRVGNPLLEPNTRWLAPLNDSALPTGTMITGGEPEPSAVAPGFVVDYMTPVTQPRTELINSGLSKRAVAPVPSVDFGRRLQLDTFRESAVRWFVTGVTKDSTGAALGTCRVVIMQANKIAVNADPFANPIKADTTSDASGNYSIQVSNSEPVQLIAYKSGGPDVSGVTVNTVAPVAT
jgi:hypothetical protein